MPLLIGGQTMPGAQPVYQGLADARQALQGGFVGVSPGAPAPGFLNNIAHPGTVLLRTDNMTVYRNTGTLASTTWALVTQ